MFEFDPDITKTNILSKIKEDMVQIVATRLLARIF